MSKSDTRGMVFNVQGYSVHDGPGIRTTVFMKGCPLRCRWCSNPESQRPNRDILYLKAKCARCHRCVSICKNGAIRYREELEPDGFITVDHDICGRCHEHACVPECYQFALEDVGAPMAVSEVLDVLVADSPFFVRSGGGVTISGGEPLVAHEFVIELLRQCKENYIHTALDTTGYAPWEQLQAILEYTDLVLYDLKHMDPAVHEELTGVSNDLILRNAERILTETKTEVIIRVPVIPGANDSNENMEASAQFMRRIGARQVDVMPYHRMGMNKFAGLGMEYLLAPEVAPPSAGRMREITRIFEANRIGCTIGGDR
jgi:pyruvate formate lyase activating enzyme